jgi:hypothetical protein
MIGIMNDRYRQETEGILGNAIFEERVNKCQKW